MAGPTRTRAAASRNWFFFFQAEDGIRDLTVTGVQTCALPISAWRLAPLLGPSRRRRHARRDVRRRAQVHPQLEPGSEALAARPRRPGGRLLARSLGGGEAGGPRDPFSAPPGHRGPETPGAPPVFRLCV